MTDEVLCSIILIITLTASVAPLNHCNVLRGRVRLIRCQRKTHAESPVMMTFNLRPDIPMEMPAVSTSKRYISKASSIAKGYGSERICQNDDQESEHVLMTYTQAPSHTQSKV